MNNIGKTILQYYLEGRYCNRTDLCAIMTTFGSDKGNSHNYTTLYHMLFSSLRQHSLNVLEVGIGTNYTDAPSSMGVNGKPGASLRGWKQYFPNAHIYGLDVDKRILFKEDRIDIFYCDQTDHIPHMRMNIRRNIGMDSAPDEDVWNVTDNIVLYDF